MISGPLYIWLLSKTVQAHRSGPHLALHALHALGLFQVSYALGK